MTHGRRHFLKATVAGGVAGLAGCSSIMGGGGGTSFPENPIDIVVPFGAGGGTDSNFRRFQPYLDEELPSNTVVDNRSGGVGRVGQQYWANQDPDGYTLFCSSGRTHFLLYRRYYDVSTGPADVAATGGVGTTPFAIISRSDAPWDDLEGLKEYADENDFLMAGLGFANDNHAALLSFVDDLGLNLDNVREATLQGGQSISQAVANGDIDIGTAAFSGAVGLAESGDVNVEAVLTEETELAGGEITYPTVNTIDAFDLTPVGLKIETYAHADIPEDRLEVLREANEAALGVQEYRDAARENYIVPSDQNGAEAQEWLETDAADFVDRYAEVVDALGIETP